jgi:hypothetical protein
MGQRAFYRTMYSWLMELPGFDGLRVPARFWMMTLVCLSVVAALAVNRLTGRARQVVVVAAVVGLLLDGWPREFRVLEAPELRPSPRGVATRIDLPITDSSDPFALYQQMFDPVPLHNGFSGYGPPHYHALRAMLEEGDARILQVLAAPGPLGIVIDHAADTDGALRKLVLSVPGAALERMESDWSSYRVPKSQAPPDVADKTGTPIPIKAFSATLGQASAALAIDGKMTTRWWTDDEIDVPAEITIELHSPARVGQVVMAIGAFMTDFPKRMQIDVSADGVAWETAWTGSPALIAYYGAVRHPRELPVVLPLNRDNVRFIRLRQMETGKFNWSILELQVLQ